MTHEQNARDTTKSTLREMERFLEHFGRHIPVGGCAIIAVLDATEGTSTVGAFATPLTAVQRVGATQARMHLVDNTLASFEEANRAIGGHAWGAPTAEALQPVLELARLPPPPGAYWLLTLVWSDTGFASCRCDAIRPDAPALEGSKHAN